MNTVKWTAVGALVVGILLIVAVAGVLLSSSGRQGPAPVAVDVEIRIVAGEVSGRLGFGLEGQPITSPGPNLTVPAGKVVRVTFTNDGTMPHTFAVVGELRYDAPVLFGAAVGPYSSPVMPGETSSVVFTANAAGPYYYICQVPGHIQYGMYGSFTVTG